MAAVTDKERATEREASSISRGGNSRGVVAMLIGMASFSTSDMMLKIAGQELPIGQIIVTRGVVATTMVLLAAVLTGAMIEGLPWLHTEKRRLIVWRSVGEVGATLCFLSGLVQLRFADATAIAQFVPLAVTAAAAIFLAEPVGWRRWLATFVGFIGVMVIIRPGTSAFDPAAFWILGSMVFVVIRDLTTRQIGPRVPGLFLISISATTVTLGGLLFAPFEQWKVVTPQMLLLLCGSAVGVISGYYAMIVAMQSGEIAVVAPFRYSVILFAIGLSVVVLGELPPVTTYIGVAIVMSAGLYTLHRERVRKRLNPPMSAPSP